MKVYDSLAATRTCMSESLNISMDDALKAAEDLAGKSHREWTESGVDKYIQGMRGKISIDCTKRSGFSGPMLLGKVAEQFDIYVQIHPFAKKCM